MAQPERPKKYKLSPLASLTIPINKENQSFKTIKNYPYAYCLKVSTFWVLWHFLIFWLAPLLLILLYPRFWIFDYFYEQSFCCQFSMEQFTNEQRFLTVKTFYQNMILLKIKISPLVDSSAIDEEVWNNWFNLTGWYETGWAI